MGFLLRQCCPPVCWVWLAWHLIYRTDWQFGLRTEPLYESRLHGCRKVHNETHLSAECRFVLQHHVLNSAFTLVNVTNWDKRLFSVHLFCRCYSTETVIATKKKSFVIASATRADYRSGCFKERDVHAHNRKMFKKLFSSGLAVFASNKILKVSSC